MNIKKYLKLAIVTLLKAMDTKLEEVKTDSGAVLFAESFEAGEPVFITEGDAQIPLPVGEYTLEDGRILKVEQEGIIASISDAEAEPEPEPEPETEASNEEQKMSADINKKLEDALAEIAALKTKLSAMDTEGNAEGITPNPEGRGGNKVVNMSGSSRPKTALSRVLDNLYNDN